MSVVTSGLVAPRLGAALAVRGRLRDERSETYANTLRLLRARTQEVEQAALGWPVHDDGPTETEAAEITARLLLYTSRDVWEHVDVFFRAYWRTAHDRMLVDAARRAGTDDVAARLRIEDQRQAMVTAVDAAGDAMRRDLGTGAFFKAVATPPGDPGTV